MIKIKSSWLTKDNRKSFNLEKNCIFCENDKELGQYHVHLKDPEVDTVEFYTCTRCKGDYNSIEEMRKKATRLLRSVMCGREYRSFVPDWKILKI